MTNTPTGPQDLESDIDRMPVIIHAQYIKDLSFENPHAPETLKATGGNPTTDIGFTMDARKIEFGKSEQSYEVTLGVEVTAKRGDMVAFLLELKYAVVVSLEGVPEGRVHPLLLIEMPRYAFPYVRQIVSDLTQQAGYAPLFLSPVDFTAFYMQRFGEKSRTTAAG